MVEMMKLPCLLGGLLSSGGSFCGDDLADAVAPDDYGCSMTAHKDDIDNLLESVGQKLGMDEGNVKRRAVSVVVKRASRSPELTCPDSCDRFENTYYGALAEAYGHYLVKAAHIARDVPGVNENILMRELAAATVFSRFVTD
jgi:hypothetical protein